MTTVFHTPWLLAVAPRPQALLVHMLAQALHQDAQWKPRMTP